MHTEEEILVLTSREEFLRERDAMWQKMGCRSIVCRRLCEEVCAYLGSVLGRAGIECGIRSVKRCMCGGWVTRQGG